MCSESGDGGCDDADDDEACEPAADEVTEPCACDPAAESWAASCWPASCRARMECMAGSVWFLPCQWPRSFWPGEWAPVRPGEWVCMPDKSRLEVVCANSRAPRRGECAGVASGVWSGVGLAARDTAGDGGTVDAGVFGCESLVRPLRPLSENVAWL